MGVYSWSAEAGGSRDAPSSMTLTYAVQYQLIPLMESDTIAQMWQTSSQTTQRAMAPARSWEASPHCDKSRYRLEIAPAVRWCTWYSDSECETNIFVSHRENDYALLPPRLHKVLLILCRGPHPCVSWSATDWFITQRKGTHLTYRGEHKQLS